MATDALKDWSAAYDWIISHPRSHDAFMDEFMYKIPEPSAPKIRPWRLDPSTSAVTTATTGFGMGCPPTVDEIKASIASVQFGPEEAIVPIRTASSSNPDYGSW